MNPQDAVAMALTVAREGLQAGELPIGAVVLAGDTPLATAYTQEIARGRRLVHAELLAMIDADARLGWASRAAPLTLVSTLEPCVMCIGAAMCLQVERVVFALRSPSDGGAAVASSRPARLDAPFVTTPEIIADVAPDAARELFATYAQRSASSGMRDWALTLARGDA